MQIERLNRDLENRPFHLRSPDNSHAYEFFVYRVILFLGVFITTASAVEPTQKPQYGTWGFDLAGADLKTKPGDDFFRYANGTWLDNTQIPPDKPGYSLRLAMTDLTEQRLHEMMEKAAEKLPNEPKTLLEKVGAFYHSFMDEAAVDSLGEKAIEPELNADQERQVARPSWRS